MQPLLICCTDSQNISGIIINWSNIISVLIGGLISMGSIYLIEYIKRKQFLKDKRNEIYQKLNANISKYLNLLKKEIEYKVLINFHDRAVVIAPTQKVSDENKNAYKERVDAMEENLVHITDLIAVQDDLFAAYHCYFVSNNKVEEILLSFENKFVYDEASVLSNYDHVSDFNQLIEQQKKDMSKGFELRNKLNVTYKELLDNIKRDIDKER